MVKISKLKMLAEALMANDSKIKEFVFCVDDAQAVNKLKDKKGPILMILYPEAESQGNQDEAVDSNATWLFILDKMKVGQKESVEFEQMEELQTNILEARDFIKDNFHKKEYCFLQRYKPGSCSIIPEYNQFGGFNGWSMSLVF